ncbi:manganese efflux pump MntP [Desulfoferrobacter suflitae]|uniref:manganese efflux pump MntP n=1 Tax=Desulfoferrobacter suflitae TaxID=2865782 RepID=UPI002164D6C9|nr:manganese efflux pump MntP family protein [Desulfoferrobacter suflitae]MCK8602542.1 manganese efflux pump MntP family protein [Desulfoferrobacter suflitae]
MKPIETALVAVALGCDAFAVGLGVGTRFCAPRQVFRLSFHFGLFQFLMPLVGWFFGQNLVGVARQWAPWIAFALLFFIGAKMSYESLRPELSEQTAHCPDPTRGFSLVMLSVATSIDALGVGFSLGILGESLLVTATWIGVTACAMTWAAMKLGNQLTQKFGRSMGVVGGIILMVIAVKLLV